MAWEVLTMAACVMRSAPGLDRAVATVAGIRNTLRVETLRELDYTVRLGRLWQASRSSR
ncbi:hypothetical protein ACFYE2_08800 [Kocuria sp. CPCC 205300]|uniref:hypothetical protein n=1 Tax=Kocuria sabuli TaxID=3071448 RepID=UPI0036DC5393